MGDRKRRMSDEEIAADVTRVQSQLDQHKALVSEFVNAVVAHWEGDCPGGRVCLGATSYDIAYLLHANADAVANALQGAVSMLATAEYDRKHPDAKPR